VVSLRIGNLEKAMFYLQKAGIEGINTDYNMGILELLNEQFEISAEFLDVEKCNYNLSLALTFAENFQKAGEILNCSPERAEKYYLMALIGARRQDIKMVYDNIQNAIEMDPTLKLMISSDPEFSAYHDQLDFKEMVD
jgi:hypothetical protein